jgi:hypothetical protein
MTEKFGDQGELGEIDRERRNRRRRADAQRLDLGDEHAAKKAPVIEPMPPTTTTTKASPITIEVGSRDWPARAHLQRAAEAGQQARRARRRT